jgi:hypothetical protein
MNRDHYDSVRWLIGSIFIASSFTLLGASFLDTIAYSLPSLCLVAFVSVLVLLIWVGYDRRVSPWIITSIKRCWAIELELENLGYNSITLHRLIRDYDKENKRKSARYLVILLTAVVVVAWVVRLILFFAVTKPS